MAPPVEDFYCWQFEANTFDPSRCRSCLRPSHMHLSSNTAEGEELIDVAADGDDCALSEDATSASSDDVSGGWSYEWSLVHSLSAEWELENCDTDIQSSSPKQGDCSDRSRSLSSERSGAAPREMTRLDPSPPRVTESYWMDEGRGRDMSRRASEARGEKEKESGYFSPNRRGDNVQQTEETSKRSYRYFERGRPLPSNYVPEPKACVPYRSVSLGLPSQRRTPETYMQETWRSESPQRYTYHSNFRRGADSQNNSPTRHSSVSPDRYKVTDYPAEPTRGSPIYSSQTRSDVSSQLPSHGASRHTSGRSSPSRRRESRTSRTASPSRSIRSHKQTDSIQSQSGVYLQQKSCSRNSRTPSQASQRHSLDSEKLYRNLESLSRRSSTANQYEGPQTRPCVASPRTRTTVSSVANTHTHSRDLSPSRTIHSPQSNTSPRELDLTDSRKSHSQGSWQGSSHSLLNLPRSHASVSSRHGAEAQVPSGSPSHIIDNDKTNEESPKISSDRSRSSLRRGMEILLTSEPKKNEPAELEEAGMTIEDYIVLADIPRIQVELEEEYTRLRCRNQSPSPCRDQRLRAYRGQDEADEYRSRLELEERGRVRERGRDRREKCRDPEIGQITLRHSAASVHTQKSSKGHSKRSAREKERAPAEQPLTQGWMSILDEQGKWRKHWFVLADTLLKYYRDSEAEESDDLEGEIDLTSCVKVSDCDVEKNYGLQIQTKRALFTLSAITSRIQQNWVKLLKQAVKNNALQSDSSSEKENPLSQKPSPSQPPARFTCNRSGGERATSPYTATAANPIHEDGQTADGADLSPTSQREEGEGWDREQAKRLEERNKWFEEGAPLGEMSSRWDSMELKRGSVPVPVTETVDSELNRKWAEFETLSFSDMSPQSLIGAQNYQSETQQQSIDHPRTLHLNSEEAEQSEACLLTAISGDDPKSENGVQTPTAETLQKEAASLRHQVESIKRERAAMRMEVDSPCGPTAPCRAWLEEMEASHQKALQELQEKHAREVKQLEEERDQLLLMERQAATTAMEVLKAAHREELERLCGETAHMDSSYNDQMPLTDALHSELNALSEQYSQKCLELRCTEQNSKRREAELESRKRELQQLQRENQELKTKLAEEISRMRYFITGQRSDVVSLSNTERTVSDLETLLKAKENEVQSLRKEMTCLQNQVQTLTKEKDAAYERYKEAYVELTAMKGRSQLEMNALNEHLRLTNAARQEEERKTS